MSPIGKFQPLIRRFIQEGDAPSNEAWQNKNGPFSRCLVGLSPLTPPKAKMSIQIALLKRTYNQKKK